MNSKVKANVGSTAVITADLVKQGVEVYPANTLLSSEGGAVWLVYAPVYSALSDKAQFIPTAPREDKAWELAIMHLAAGNEITEDLRVGIMTHRRTFRKLWKDVRDQGDYAVACRSYAALHYGEPFSFLDRMTSWLGGAATGFFLTDYWCRQATRQELLSGGLQTRFARLKGRFWGKSEVTTNR